MTIEYEEDTTVDFDFDSRQLAETVINAALDHEDFPYEAEVNLTLVDNEQIHRINKEYRQIDRPTDVLSFPLLSYETAGDFSGLEEEAYENFNPDTGEILLGDIVISVEKVMEQAMSSGHSPQREYALLILHSVLHLLGYDHMTDEERIAMEAKQNEILDDLKIYR